MKIVDFGESHGPAIGGVIEGVSSGFRLDMGAIREMLQRRRPGGSSLVSARMESDEVEFLSGISPDGVTLGSPIGFIIRNRDAHSNDYAEMEGKFRPNHADYAWWCRYGIMDWRGGGRASARRTASRVVAGAIALQLLQPMGIQVKAYASRIGKVELPEIYPDVIPDDLSEDMKAEIAKAREEKDSVGGVVSCIITGVPAGIGNPADGKLHAMLAAAMMGINAAKGFEYGDGFKLASCRGSECLDLFTLDEAGRITTTTNHSGGIQGGISNGQPICFSVAFKPTPTIPRELPTVNVKGERCTVTGRGRHDPCVAVRAIPVVEAEAAIVVYNAICESRNS